MLSDVLKPNDYLVTLDLKDGFHHVPVIQYFRENGIRIIIYMDDILIAAEKDKIDSDLSFVRKTLESLGWNINYEKSCSTLNTPQEFLGFVIDSIGEHGVPGIKVPQKKVTKVQKDILAGQCIAVRRAVFPGNLKLRSVYRLLKTKWSWKTTLQWTEDSLRHLNHYGGSTPFILGTDTS